MAKLNVSFFSSPYNHFHVLNGYNNSTAIRVYDKKADART